MWITHLVALAFVTLAVQAPAKAPEAPVDIAALWAEPEPGRDLFYGVGGRKLAPDPSATYTVIGVKKSGFSSGYTVRDPEGSEWSVKLYPEARTEVVASRILWAVGYHQPPIYALEQWSADGAKGPNPQPVARFREKNPGFHGLTEKEKSDWSYAENPFVGTKPLAGLLVLHVMLGNSDLKPIQNVIYTLDRPVEGAKQWYVARDLGQAFGRTGVIAPRDDPDAFDKTPFITDVTNGVVTFEYRGRFASLFKNITVADVQWICSRLAKITDQQWADAFRAGGYAEPTAQRYIRRMKQKISEGLAAGQQHAGR